jgi:hypothetical protein
MLVLLSRGRPRCLVVERSHPQPEVKLGARTAHTRAVVKHQGNNL